MADDQFPSGFSFFNGKKERARTGRIHPILTRGIFGVPVLFFSLQLAVSDLSD